MKIIKTTEKANKVTRLIVELSPGESLRACKQGETLVRIDPDAHYTLGEPMRDDVIAGHILADIKPAHWCSISQKWVD